MYISLKTDMEMQQIKDNMLWLGLFMLSGGLASLLHNLLLQETIRWNWAGAALLVFLIGAVLVAAGRGIVQLKDTYISITQDSVSYRLHLLSSKHLIHWQQVASMQLSDRHVLFDLYNGRQILLRLASIESGNVANHVAVSLQQAALQHNVSVNGVRFNLK